MRFASSSFASAILATMLALVAPVRTAASTFAGSGLVVTPRAAAFDPRTAAARAEAARASEAIRTMAPPAGLRVLALHESGVSAAGSIDALERAGYRVEVAILPATFFVRPSARARALPSGFDDVTRAPSLESAPSVLPDAASSIALTASEDPFGGRGDALPPASSSGGAASARATPSRSGPLVGLPYGARWRDTSELMLGRVAVSILFPESDGSVDPNRYDWTPALQDSVIRSATRGLLKWTELAAARGVSLTFLLEIDPALPTRYEPIQHPVSEEQNWIQDVLEPLVGYRGDAVAMGYDLANAVRARLGTQWSALIFAVQDDSSSTGHFPDGYIAHAQLGGPWYIVPINNLNTKSARLDFYMEHEMTHMFWALDEFPASYAWWNCQLTTGYFNQPNSNSSLPFLTSDGRNACLQTVTQCLMTGNYPDSVCSATLHQIGWVDQDRSGVLDLFETRPLIRADSTKYVGAIGLPIPVAGTASDVALPNQNPFWFGAGDSITVATIDSTWYRVDGGSWIPIVPDDGIYDEGEERFHISIASPGLGDHKLELQALNSNGFEMTAPASVTISVTNGSGGEPGQVGQVSPRPSLEAGPTPSRGEVRLTLRGPPGARVTAHLYDLQGRAVRSWELDIPSSGQIEWTWDGHTDRGGMSGGGLYFVEARVGGDRLTRRILLLRH